MPLMKMAHGGNREDPYRMTNLIRDTERGGMRGRLAAEMRRLWSEAGDTLTEAEIDAFRKEQARKFPGLA